MSRPGESQAIPTDNLARLIRERPVFVNLGRGFWAAAPERRSLREYIDFRGVFGVEDGVVVGATPNNGTADISDP
jgi:hypothetical protein